MSEGERPASQGSDSGSAGYASPPPPGYPAGDDSSADSSYDAPLDFSLKRGAASPSSTTSSSSQPRLGVLRSPELGQTAVPPARPPPTKQVKHEEKIGEPQTALPGMLPGTTLPGLGLPAMHGLHSLAAMGMMSPGPLLPPHDTSPPGGDPRDKSTRPFKAYPKDPLSLPLGYFGLPGMSPFPGLDMAAIKGGQPSQEEVFKQYRDYLAKLQDQARPLGRDHSPPTPQPTPPKPSNPMPPMPATSSSSPTGNVSSTSSSSNGGSTPTSPDPSSAPTVTTTTTNSGRKRGRTLPEEQKDAAYWERRRKNNDAAKRSRDARRAKEDEIAIRAAFLEQENLKLRVEVTALKNETAKLRCMLYNS